MLNTSKSNGANAPSENKQANSKPDGEKLPKKMKCGLVMPISEIDGIPASHWEEVRAIVGEALADTPFHVVLVSDADEVGVIQKRIVQNIFDNDMVICDVSAKNPNVMFELGMRLAFDKPAIIIKDDLTNYSFDTAPIEHLTYPRDLHYHTINVFKNKLREKVVATYEASKSNTYTTFLKHFGEFVVAQIEEKPVGRDEYILSTLKDLRNEVRQLRKSARDVMLHPDSYMSTSWESSEFEKYPIGQFVLDRMVEAKSPKEFIEAARNPLGETQRALVKSYLRDYGQGLTMDEIDRVRKRVQSCVEMYRQADFGS